jgi:hypothetical protein
VGSRYRWSALDRHLELIGVDAEVVEKLVDGDSAFLVGGHGPELVEVKLGERPGDGVEVSGHILRTVRDSYRSLLYSASSDPVEVFS